MRGGGGLLTWVGVLAMTVAAGASQPAAGPTDVAMDLRTRAFRQGEVVAVDVRAVADLVDVQVFDRVVPAYRIGTDRWQALVGIDLEQRPETYPIRARVNGQPAAETALTVSPRTFAVRKLTVDPDFVNPPASVQTRIDEESAFLREVYAASAPNRQWSGPFRRPVPHRANSRFGTRSVFNGEARNPHTGTDFLSPAGTPIKAPNAGRVVAARDLYFSGRTVILDHGLGVFSQLAHLSRIDVREGAVVESGQVVGLVGATGRVTGAHLHWGLRVGEARVDALSLLAVLNE